uniref:uncharacterized protein LOC122600605 n=1 Tax=Erigeron canadensis TaxID=72917 RepID=UPI001CB8AED5|nr:uncharacterized protein LOC122600605 [Erigeron canadensis]
MPTGNDQLGDQKQPKQQFDREIRDMMSVLTRRLAHLQKKPTDGGSGSHIHEEEEDDHGGFGVITMAGSNEGATMRGEMSMEDHKSGTKDHNGQTLTPLTTYLNGNFQGVNNSIMVRGSYSANDPGIHLDFEDHYVQRLSPRKQVRKGKKKTSFSGSSTSDQST